MGYPEKNRQTRGNLLMDRILPPITLAGHIYDDLSTKNNDVELVLLNSAPMCSL